MAAFNKLPSGYWRVQVRRKQKYASRTFRLKGDAEQWALGAERAIAIGKGIHSPQINRRTTFGDLIRLHITDMAEVGKAAPDRERAHFRSHLFSALRSISQSRRACFVHVSVSADRSHGSFQ